MDIPGDSNAIPFWSKSQCFHYTLKILTIWERAWPCEYGRLQFCSAQFLAKPVSIWFSMILWFAVVPLWLSRLPSSRLPRVPQVPLTNKLESMNPYEFSFLQNTLQRELSWNGNIHKITTSVNIWISVLHSEDKDFFFTYWKKKITQVKTEPHSKYIPKTLHIHLMVKHIHSW